MSVYAVAGSSTGSSLTNLNVGSQLDAFGRLRVSEPYELFSKSCEFDNPPLFYENVLTGTAAQAYSSDTTSTTLTAAAAGGGASAKGGGAGGPIATDVPISANYAGVRDTLTLAVRPLGTSSTTFHGSLVWSEFY